MLFWVGFLRHYQLAMLLISTLDMLTKHIRKYACYLSPLKLMDNFQNGPGATSWTVPVSSAFRFENGKR